MHRRVELGRVLCVTLSFFLVLLSAACKPQSVDAEYIPYNFELGSYIALGSILGVEYTPADTEVTDGEINYLICEDLENKLMYVMDFPELVLRYPETDTVLYGDTVVLSCTASVNGENYPDAAMEHTLLTVGSGNVNVYGFEGGLDGMKINVPTELVLYLPSDYYDSATRGREIVFTITVESVTKRRLVPNEMTDEQLRKLTSEGSYADYIEQKRMQAQTTKEAYARMKRETDCFYAALNNATLISYPQVEIDRYISEYNEYQLFLAQSLGYKNLDEYLYSIGMTEEENHALAMRYAREDIFREMFIYAVARTEKFDSISTELFNKYAERYLLEYELDSIDELVMAVGYYNVQKVIMTDIVKQYIADNGKKKEEEPIDPIPADDEDC